MYSHRRVWGRTRTGGLRLALCPPTEGMQAAPEVLHRLMPLPCAFAAVVWDGRDCRLADRKCLATIPYCTHLKTQGRSLRWHIEHTCSLGDGHELCSRHTAVFASPWQGRYAAVKSTWGQIRECMGGDWVRVLSKCEVRVRLRDRVSAQTRRRCRTPPPGTPDSGRR